MKQTANPAEASDTLPFAILLLEPQETLPFTFSPVAPGYFTPSPSWAMRVRPDNAGIVLTYAPKPRVLLWSAQHIRHLLDRAHHVLGDVIPKAIEADHRGLKHKTRPLRRHRFAELWREVCPLIYLYTREARPFLDPLIVAELHAVVVILERAAKETTWSEIRPTCVDAHNFHHTLITFLSIEMLERTQHLVLPALSVNMSTREPDIRIHFGTVVHMEVKVPNVLVRAPGVRSEVMTENDAHRLIERVARSAVGTGGQIRADRPGMLVIGGFCLAEEELPRLEEAASSYMKRRGQRYPFLSSIGLTFLSYGRNPALYGGARAMPGFKERAQSTLSTQLPLVSSVA